MINTFSGGIHPETFKELTVDKKIAVSPVPKKVFIPLLQHTGNPAKPRVKIKDKVLKGQLIADSDGFISSNVHASTSGEVIAIEEIVNPVYGRTECVVIESDGEDNAVYSGTKRIPADLTAEDMIGIIKDAGIVGLGGAAFPTHVKLLTAQKNKVDSLIINGVECEPYLTCDHRLMVEKTREIIEGIGLLERIVKVKNVYIAIENNKLSAIFSIEKAIEQLKTYDLKLKTKVVRLKTKYPQGGEKQLIKAVLNREVPPSKLPLDVGCMVQNVGTTFAIYEAVYEGKPLVERCVTLTGPSLKNPGNFMIRIGSLLSDVLEACCGGFIKEPKKIIIGGPMMGIAQYTMDIPVIKGTTGVIFLSKDEVSEYEEGVCIRCGKCVEACPMGLAPTTLMHLVKKDRFPEAKEWGIMNCFECGACAYICPAKIPLLDYMKLGKAKSLILERKAV